MRQTLVTEFEAFLRQIESFRPTMSKNIVGGSSLADQLARYVASGQLLTLSQNGNSSIFTTIPGWSRISHDIPRAILVWSSIEEPMSLDLLTRRFPELLALYRPFIRAMEQSGFFVETEIDREGTLGVVARNAGIAQILFYAVLSDSIDRLNQIKAFADSIVWRDTLDAIGIPEQTQLVRVIQRISPPNGAYHREYDRIQDLRFIANMLAEIRSDRDIELTSLMLTEGIVLREIARQLDGSPEQLDLLRDGKIVLQRVRDILRERPASPARTHQLAAVLTALAATVGSIMLHELKTSRVPGQGCLDLAREARVTAQEAQSYQETYNPIDVAFWTNRDLYLAFKAASETNQKHDFSSSIRDAVDGMADALDRAAELGQIDKVQQNYLSDRLVEFEGIAGDFNIARSMAEEEAAHGRFAGVCWIARQLAVNPKTNRLGNPLKSDEALRYLEQFAPTILTAERATTLMQRLWLGSHLGDFVLDAGRHCIGCDESEWRRFEKILFARRQQLSPTCSPYVNFWLAATAAHLGAFQQMQTYFEEISSSEIGFTRRRLAPLIYLCSESGSPIECEAIVRRREGADLSLYVPMLGREVKLPRRFEGLPQLDEIVRGDVLHVFLALNYWGPLAIRPNWELEQKAELSRNRAR